MTNTRMSVDEREAFLANVYIGVLSIPRKEGATPLTVPMVPTPTRLRVRRKLLLH